MAFKGEHGKYLPPGFHGHEAEVDSACAEGLTSKS